MTLRIQRNKRVSISRLPGKYILKLRLIPWIYTKNGCVWLASMAVGKSMRQINDWMNQRQNLKAHQMATSLTGNLGPKAQIAAFNQLHEWLDDMPYGDSVALRCDSANPEKQFQIWKKWFLKKSSKKWKINEEHKSFFYKCI
jgi:hypothetical protein